MATTEEEILVIFSPFRSQLSLDTPLLSPRRYMTRFPLGEHAPPLNDAVAATLNDYASLLRKANRKSEAREMSVRASQILARNRATKLANQSVHVKTLINTGSR